VEELLAVSIAARLHAALARLEGHGARMFAAPSPSRSPVQAPLTSRRLRTYTAHLHKVRRLLGKRRWWAHHALAILCLPATRAGALATVA